ncbi:MAG TPA: methyltransferase domain-containing protein [Actinocrinis sp.]
MPTIPEHVRTSHENRQMAESFGVDAERYDRSRPRYPEALVRRIAAGSPGTDVLDVGCGTGIAARQFEAAADSSVLGVEADPRMAGFARSRGLQVEVARFEDWDPAGRRFDTVIAAQTWHWIDPVAGAAKAAQALRPGGRLALFWNVYNIPAELARAFGEVFDRVVPDSPFRGRTQQPATFPSALYTRAVDGIRQTGAFAEPEEAWRYDWQWTYSRDEYLDQVPTTGGVTRLPPDRMALLLEGYGAAIDAAGGSFTLDFTTEAATATLAGPAS